MVIGRRTLAGVLAGALASIAIAGTAAASVQIRKVNTADFPKVQVVVSAPGKQLHPGDVSVSENGKNADVLRVDAIGEARHAPKVATVLAVDTSGSMQGKALVAAVHAARVFVRGMPSKLEVGVVAFSDRPRLVTAPTSDHARATRALGALHAAGETALYDAVAAASASFSDADQRYIIVLSDGGNTTGHHDLGTAIAAARRAHATIDTVGLKTPDTDVAALRALAARTGGRYQPAATADLNSIYSGLARSIGDQYVITYRSELSPGAQADVVVQAGSGRDTAVLQAPARPVHTEPAPAAPRRSVGAALPGGQAALYTGLAACFLAVFALVFLGLRARDQARSRARITRAVRPVRPEPGDEAHDRGPSPVAVGIRKAAEKVSSGKMGGALDPMLERAGLKLRRDELLVLIATGTLGGAALGLLVLGPALAVLLAVVGGAAPLGWVSHRARVRLRSIRSQLPEVLALLASSLRAGHSFIQALDSVAREMEGAPAEEFSRVVTEIRLGRQVDEALNELADRIGSEDFRWAVMAVNIQREVGGNLAEVLDNVADTLREREDIRRQVDVLSAEGRLSLWVLAALPFLFGLYLAFASPQSLGLLFGTGIGLVMVAGGAVLLVAGIVWMRRIVRIDV